MKCRSLFSGKNNKKYFKLSSAERVVGWCEGVMYLLSPGRPADIGL